MVDPQQIGERRSGGATDAVGGGEDRLHLEAGGRAEMLQRAAVAHLRLMERSGAVAASQSMYWSYELKIRDLESWLGILAVASGQAMAFRRALFRDPTSTGYPLKVGDHMCKAHWRIKRIVDGGVVVELEQDTGGVKPKLVERMLPINPEEEIQK